MRRVYDCIIYNGEIEQLEIRLHELDSIVDIFVIVESRFTFSGLPKDLQLPAQASAISEFTHKIRYFAIETDLPTDNPWEREGAQRNAILQGIQDADAQRDVIVMSDVDEIPTLRAIQYIRDNPQHQVFGIALSFRYFALNYCNTAGPEAQTVWSVATTPQMLEQYTPDQLRHLIRAQKIPAFYLLDAGWHFSYLADRAGIIKKIQSFSHQELNTKEVIDAIDISRMIRNRADLFGRDGYVWEIVSMETLPAWVQQNLDRFAHFVLAPSGRFLSEPKSSSSA